MEKTLFTCFPRKKVYTIAFFCSVTSGSGDRPRKEGSHGGGVYSFFPCPGPLGYTSFRDRKGTPKNFCDKDFAELSSELSSAICLKSLVLLGSALELFRTFSGTVRAILGVWGSFFKGAQTMKCKL